MFLSEFAFSFVLLFSLLLFIIFSIRVKVYYFDFL
jgi:hypothetical protein